jgi:hypothetical protein
MNYYNFVNKYTLLIYYNQLILKLTTLLSYCKELVVVNIVSTLIMLLKEMIELIFNENKLVSVFPVYNL